MSYLGSWKIDDYVPIPVTTHKFSTGAAFAPTVLTYSIYEDGGTTGIAKNVDMTPASPFDGVVGFYLARPQLTAAAGFEKGKNYTVLVKATVDSVAAIVAHTFQIEAEVDSNSVSGTVATVTDLTNLPTIPADWLTAAGVKADAVTKIQANLALEATLTAIKGAGWTDETLAKIVADIAAIVGGGGATAQEVWEYATRVLTAGTNLSVPTAGEIWANTTRTLTNAGTSVTTPATGDPLEIYKDSTVVISITDLGDISGLDQEGDKLYFTAKENLDDADSSAIIQIYILAPGAGTPGADTLTYINGAAATAGDGIITIVDKVTGAINITLYPAAADDLPIYAATSLYWDVKTFDDESIDVVHILQRGTMYIYGTATKSIT